MHPSTGDARALYVHERITHCHREPFQNNPIVTCSTCCARYRCVDRAYSALSQINCLKSARNLAAAVVVALQTAAAVISGEHNRSSLYISPNSAHSRTYSGRASKNTVSEHRV